MSTFAEVITAGRAGCDVHLDLRDPIGQMALPAGIDVLINTAAAFTGDTFEEMLQTESLNVLGTLKLCQLCAQTEVGHMILTSSIFATLPSDSPFYSTYALSKRHADEIAQHHHSRYAPPQSMLTILRPTRFYGVGAAYRKNQPFLFRMMDDAEQGRDILIHGSNDALRNFIHVEDLARIIARVIQRKLTGTYVCMATHSTKLSEIAAAAIEAFESTSKVGFISAQADIADDILEENIALYQLIDYFPQISLLQGMEMEALNRRNNR